MEACLVRIDKIKHNYAQGCIGKRGVTHDISHQPAEDIVHECEEFLINHSDRECGNALDRNDSASEQELVLHADGKGIGDGVDHEENPRLTQKCQSQEQHEILEVELVLYSRSSCILGFVTGYQVIRIFAKADPFE